ncbi:hypothetical protein FOL46_004720 [Perkinsus olseni]|nr:hypothetical protein FOL46_004720 [Perkinsus olseni]
MSASLLAGKTLLKQDGTAVSADEVMLEKDIVALYFAAHWCPDCIAFTPTVKKFYEDVKAKNPDKLEIIFVSSDKSENEQVAYHQNDMADWLRVPYSDKRTRAMLKKEYGVCAKKEMEDIGMSDSQRKSGIPTLVVLSKNRRTVKVFDAGADIEKYGAAAVDRLFAVVSTLVFEGVSAGLKRPGKDKKAWIPRVEAESENVNYRHYANGRGRVKKNGKPECDGKWKDAETYGRRKAAIKQFCIRLHEKHQDDDGYRKLYNEYDCVLDPNDDGNDHGRKNRDWL